MISYLYCEYCKAIKRMRLTDRADSRIDKLLGKQDEQVSVQETTICVKRQEMDVQISFYVLHRLFWNNTQETRELGTTDGEKR